MKKLLHGWIHLYVSLLHGKTLQRTDMINPLRHDLAERQRCRGKWQTKTGRQLDVPNVLTIRSGRATRGLVPLFHSNPLSKKKKSMRLGSPGPTTNGRVRGRVVTTKLFFFLGHETFAQGAVFFPTSLRLPNLTAQEETLQSLESYALCQGVIVFLPIYLSLKHVISIAVLMSLRTSGRRLLRVIMLQYASSSRKLPIDDTRANIFPAGCLHIPFFCSILQQLHDDQRFSDRQGTHQTASGQSF